VTKRNCSLYSCRGNPHGSASQRAPLPCLPMLDIIAIALFPSRSQSTLLVIEPRRPQPLAFRYCSLLALFSYEPPRPYLLPLRCRRTRISHRDLRPLFLPHVPANRRHSKHHNRARAPNYNAVEVRGLVDGRPAQVAQWCAEEEGGCRAGHVEGRLLQQCQYIGNRTARRG
jgi:hypothetical protein